jgi:hypothetical protein
MKLVKFTVDLNLGCESHSYVNPSNIEEVRPSSLNN